MPGQLTFEDLLLNPSVEQTDENRLSKQAIEIFNMFDCVLLPRVSNVDMAAVALQYNARLWEIRRFLEPRGKTIKLVVKGSDGVNFYEMVNLDN